MGEDKKKVKLLTSWEEAGVGAHEAGEELELEASVADQLIEEGTAEEVLDGEQGGDNDDDKDDNEVL